MAEFYEFHDSILEGMEHLDGKLVLRFRAYLHLQPEDQGEDAWTGWVQRIEVTLDDPVVELPFLHYPVQIYEGSLKAAHIDARPEDIVGDEIPASLRSACNVEICIFGQGCNGEEYKDMVVQGASAAITFKGEPKFVEKWRHTESIEPTDGKIMGIGEYDFGLPDLATNKKYMERFGQKSKRTAGSSAELGAKSAPDPAQNDDF
jgi:hypothetical protein